MDICLHTTSKTVVHIRGELVHAIYSQPGHSQSRIMLIHTHGPDDACTSTASVYKACPKSVHVCINRLIHMYMQIQFHSSIATVSTNVSSVVPLTVSLSLCFFSSRSLFTFFSSSFYMHTTQYGVSQSISVPYKPT